MISCIICCKNKELVSALKENIKQTIGVPFEIIEIDNEYNNFSIAKAYNLGASQAVFDILCFVHEDVSFLQESWGTNTIQHFEKDEALGLLGVAGSTIKTKTLSSWWQPTFKNIEPKRQNIFQYYKHLVKDSSLISINPHAENISSVAVLDGVLLITKKSIWNKFKFDELLLKGFHCYDLDYSLTIGKHYKIAVVFDILLSHYSEGKVNREYFIDLIAVHKKHQKNLPVNVGSFSNKDVFGIELLLLIASKKALKKNGFSVAQRIRYLSSVLLYFIFPLKKILWWISIASSRFYAAVRK